VDSRPLGFLLGFGGSVPLGYAAGLFAAALPHVGQFDSHPIDDDLVMGDKRRNFRLVLGVRGLVSTEPGNMELTRRKFPVYFLLREDAPTLTLGGALSLLVPYLLKPILIPSQFMRKIALRLREGRDRPKATEEDGKQSDAASGHALTHYGVLTSSACHSPIKKMIATATSTILPVLLILAGWRGAQCMHTTEPAKLRRHFGQWLGGV
jgi:hypothetical protein